MWYRIEIHPKSPISSDLSADIFWGHILWAIRFVFSERRLQEVIEDTKEGNGMVCSSILPLIGSELFIPGPKFDFGLVNIDIDPHILKKLKKQQYIPISIIESMRDNFSLSKYAITLAEWLEKREQEFIIEDKQFHNTINRLSGTTPKEGGLFAQKSYWFNCNLAVFLHWPYSKEDLYSVLKYIETTGYGADKSIGRGYLSIPAECIQTVSKEWFGMERGNMIILLSACISDSDEFVWKESYYRITSKIGRLGGVFAYVKPYYKRPLFFLEQGSVLKPVGKKDWYGVIKQNVHIDKRIVHYGVGVGYGINLVN